MDKQYLYKRMIVFIHLYSGLLLVILELSYSVSTACSDSQRELMAVRM
jgi:hypothetical protein